MEEQSIKSFWDDIIRNPDGSLNEEQVYKELADFSFVMEEVPKVYMHITNDLLSKVNYYADGVIAKADDCYKDNFIETLYEFIDVLTEDGFIHPISKDKVLNLIPRYF